jgi:hypothetical protein
MPKHPKGCPMKIVTSLLMMANYFYTRKTMNTHKRPEVHARIPESDFTELVNIAANRNVTVSELVREAVKAFLVTLMVPGIKPSATLEILQNELEEVRVETTKWDNEQFEAFQIENQQLHTELHDLKIQNEALNKNFEIIQAENKKLKQETQKSSNAAAIRSKLFGTENDDNGDEEINWI